MDGKPGLREKSLDLLTRRTKFQNIIEGEKDRTALISRLANAVKKVVVDKGLTEGAVAEVAEKTEKAAKAVAEGAKKGLDIVQNSAEKLKENIENKATANPAAAKYILGIIILALLGLLIFAVYGFVRRNKKKRDHATMPVKDDYKNERSYDGQYYMIIPNKELVQLRSTNHTVGFWLYIRDWGYRQNSRKNIITRGYVSDNFNASNICPEIYLSARVNDLNIDYETSYGRENIKVPNIPTHKWVCIVIVVELNTVTIYLDGKLRQTSLYNGIVKVNNGDLHINYGGGYDGRVAIIKIWDKPYKIKDVRKFYESTRKNKILEALDKKQGQTS